MRGEKMHAAVDFEIKRLSHGFLVTRCDYESMEPGASYCQKWCMTLGSLPV
jgi:hypothetical protein